MRLVIDTREHKLQTFLEASPHAASMQVKQLAIGDIHLITDDEAPKTLAIIERKSIADLAASRKDKRWEEQKHRLLQERAQTGCKLIYVIEGTSFSFNEEGTTHGLPSKTIVSMVLNCIFKSQITIVNTKSTMDTADFLCALLTRFPEYLPHQEYSEIKVSDASPGNPSNLSNPSNPNVIEHQASLIKTTKKDNITQSTILTAQLCAIPGISCKKATDLLTHFKYNHISEFVNALQEAPTQKERIKLLTQVKGVGAKLASDILCALLPPLSH